MPLFLALFLLAYSAVEIWFADPSNCKKIEFRRYWLCPTSIETQQEYSTYLDSGAQPAISGFADLLERDPASSYRWCDLAEVAVESGDEKTARYCIGHALDLAPHAAPILLRAANFYWRVQNIPAALQLTNRLLSEIKEYDAIIFGSFDRFEVPVQAILHDGIPANSRAVQAYLRHLFSAKRLGDARLVWSWIAEHRFTDDSITADYSSYLLSAAAFDEAKRVWAEYAGTRRRDYLVNNALFNGDFESAPIPSAPLDWQFTPLEAARIGRDSLAHSGKFALRVQFAGAGNFAFHHVGQTAVVRPGRHSFEYWIKTESITTDEGIRFRIFDPESAERLDILTAAVTGTTDWQRKQIRFAVPPQTHLVQAQVVRLASKKFDSKIAGSVWIDSVRLSP